jgi:hypothetical protein
MVCPVAAAPAPTPAPAPFESSPNETKFTCNPTRPPRLAATPSPTALAATTTTTTGHEEAQSGARRFQFFGCTWKRKFRQGHVGGREKNQWSLCDQGLEERVHHRQRRSRKVRIEIFVTCIYDRLIVVSARVQKSASSWRLLGNDIPSCLGYILASRRKLEFISSWST